MKIFNRDTLAKLKALDRSQAVIEFKLDGTILTANANFLNIFGYTINEIRGRHHGLFVDPDERASAAYRAFWASLAGGAYQTAEYRRLAKDGREVWIQGTYNPILDRRGRVIKIVKFATDITADVATRQEFRLLSLVADATDNSIVITDADGFIEYVNAAFTRLTGYTGAEVVGRRPGAILQGASTCREAPQRIRAKLALRQPVYDEIVNYTKAGRPYWISLSINPICDEAGRLRRFVSIQADITQRKAAEEQLARRNQELQVARRQADAANEAKSRFLAMMSHELRTPMTGIIGLSDLILVEHRDTYPDRIRARVEQLRHSGRQLLDLLNDILDLSKIEAGQLTIETTRFHPEAGVREVIQLLEPLAQANGNRLQLDEEGMETLPRALLGDPTRIRQILFNVVGNANKFTRDGCIAIAIRYGRSAATGSMPGASRPAPCLHFTVRDTGIGMSPDQLRTLYEPFVQGDVSTTRTYGGTGLGLTICKNLIEAMNGTITVESTPGLGTCLSFAIPAEPAPAIVAQPAAPAARRLALADVRASRILLAEDTPITRDIIAAMLRLSGHDVVEVEDGALAVAAARAAAFDLVLMDMQMPVMDGPTATRAIRALPGPASRVPILGLTADALPEHRTTYMTSGLDGYVTKPIDWTELAEAIAAFRRDHRGPGRAEVRARGAA